MHLCVKAITLDDVVVKGHDDFVTEKNPEHKKNREVQGCCSGFRLVEYRNPRKAGKSSEVAT